MKAFLFVSTLMALAPLAQANCVAYDPNMQPLCGQQPNKLVCEARVNVCHWTGMNILGDVNVETQETVEKK